MTNPTGIQPTDPPAGWQPTSNPPPGWTPSNPPPGQPPATDPGTNPAATPGQAPVEATGGQPSPAGLTSRGKVRTTRSSAWWVGLIIAAVLLVLLLIFIAQNSPHVTVHFFSAHGQVSLAVALLLAAVAGVLLIAIPGTARIMQLRRALKQNAGVPTRYPSAWRRSR